MAVGQLSDPYSEGEVDDDVEITVSGLPGDDQPISEGEADEVADLIADDEGSLDDAENLVGDEARSEIESSLHVDPASEEDDEDEDDDDEDEEDEEGDDSDEDEIAYDLAEWEDARLDLLFNRLEEEGIGYLWDGEELFVREADEEPVDALLEEVSSPGALAAASDDGEGGAQLLGDLFVVADILRHEPEDNQASARLLELDKTAEDSEPPYGIAQPEWDALREKVKATADLLLTEDDIDFDAVVESATDLRAAIRPYV